MIENPKTEGTHIIDAIPQTGLCPMKCSECYYNDDGFYLSKDVPNVPTSVEALGRIVRVNSGHDSNIDRTNVMNVTQIFRDRFYNTCIPILHFGRPTILTINGRDTDNSYVSPHKIEGSLETLMALRFRVNTWNLPLLENALNEYFSYGLHAPFILTPMRYKSVEAIPETHRKFYTRRKHIVNDWWCLTEEGFLLVKSLMRYPSAFLCGNPFDNSSLCSQCRLCEHFYVSSMNKILGVRRY